MLRRFRLLAAINVLLWLVTLALPQTGYLSLAQAAAPDIAVAGNCLLAPADQDFDAKRNAKRKLAPLASPAGDRGNQHAIGLPVDHGPLGDAAAATHAPATRSQLVAVRFSFVFHPCAPPPERLVL